MTSRATAPAQGWKIAMRIKAALFDRPLRFAGGSKIRSRLLRIVVVAPMVAAAFTTTLLLAARMS